MWILSTGSSVGLAIEKDSDRRIGMNRSWFRKLTTLVVGLGAVVALSMTNVGCSSCKKCGSGCDKPCCKKPCEPKDAKKP